MRPSLGGSGTSLQGGTAVLQKLHLAQLFGQLLAGWLAHRDRDFVDQQFRELGVRALQGLAHLVRPQGGASRATNSSAIRGEGTSGFSTRNKKTAWYIGWAVADLPPRLAATSFGAAIRVLVQPRILLPCDAASESVLFRGCDSKNRTTGQPRLLLVDRSS